MESILSPHTSSPLLSFPLRTTCEPKAHIATAAGGAEVEAIGHAAERREAAPRSTPQHTGPTGLTPSRALRIL